MFGRVVVCGTRRWSIRRQFKWRFDQQKIEYRWQISNRGEEEMFESKDWSSENIWEGISCLDPINVSLSFPLHHQRRRSSFSLIKFTLDWRGIRFFVSSLQTDFHQKRVDSWQFGGEGGNFGNFQIKSQLDEFTMSACGWLLFGIKDRETTLVVTIRQFGLCYLWMMNCPKWLVFCNLWTILILASQKKWRKLHNPRGRLGWWRFANGWYLQFLYKNRYGWSGRLLSMSLEFEEGCKSRWLRHRSNMLSVQVGRFPISCSERKFRGIPTS